MDAFPTPVGVCGKSWILITAVPRCRARLTGSATLNACYQVESSHERWSHLGSESFFASAGKQAKEFRDKVFLRQRRHHTLPTQASSGRCARLTADSRGIESSYRDRPLASERSLDPGRVLPLDLEGSELGDTP